MDSGILDLDASGASGLNVAPDHHTTLHPQRSTRLYLDIAPDEGECVQNCISIDFVVIYMRTNLIAAGRAVCDALYVLGIFVEVAGHYIRWPCQNQGDRCGTNMFHHFGILQVRYPRIPWSIGVVITHLL